MADTEIGTSSDIEPFVAAARALVRDAVNAERFTAELVRLVGQQDVHLPGEAWTYINEMFYAAEEHVADAASRAAKGGLDDRGLVEIVSSQLPALEEAFDRVRAEEMGGPATLVEPPGAEGAELIRLVRGFLADELDLGRFVDEFPRSFRGSRSALGPRLLAAAASVDTAIARFEPDGSRRRMYEIDEPTLRARITDVEPRLAAAAEAG